MYSNFLVWGVDFDRWFCSQLYLSVFSSFTSSQHSRGLLAYSSPLKKISWFPGSWHACYFSSSRHFWSAPSAHLWCCSRFSCSNWEMGGAEVVREWGVTRERLSRRLWGCGSLFFIWGRVLGRMSGSTAISLGCWGLGLWSTPLDPQWSCHLYLCVIWLSGVLSLVSSRFDRRWVCARMLSWAIGWEFFRCKPNF